MIQPVREAINKLDRLGRNERFRAMYEARKKETMDRQAETMAAVKENNIDIITQYLISQQINPEDYKGKLEKIKSSESQNFLLGLFGKSKPEILQQLDRL